MSSRGTSTGYGESGDGINVGGTDVRRCTTRETSEAAG